MTEAATARAAETSVLRKVAWRLVPFMGLLYFVAYLDRVNVGYAALTMNQDIGLSAAAYGAGAGIFFIGYFLFEIASNLILEGLCMDDLKAVEAGTQSLLKMPSEAKWRVSNDMMYRRYSNEFVQAVEELQKEAEENDMDGASMAWMNVTMKCMKCHKWVRNTVLADSEE